MFNSNLIKALSATMGAVFEPSNKRSTSSTSITKPTSPTSPASPTEDSDSDSSNGSSGMSVSSLDAIYLTTLVQESNVESNVEKEEVDNIESEKLLKEKSIEEKLQEIFNLQNPEKLKGEFRCTLLRSIMLQGFMYLTEDHICFHAYFPREQDIVLKDGNLAKKNFGNRYERYHFTLQNDVLTYYVDPMDMYCPEEIIDLKYALKVEKTSKKNGFKIITPKRTYKFQADSQTSMEEWIAQLERSIVRANNDGDNVKIVIPIESIENIENNLSKNFSNTIHIVTSGQDDHEDYFFVVFSESESLYEELCKCWEKHKLLHPSRFSRSINTRQSASESDVSPVRSITTFIKHKRSKSREELPLPTSPRSVPKLSRTTTLETITPETTDSQWNITKYVSKRAQVFLKNPKKYISSFEEDLSEETRQHFKEHFALPENEKLHAVFYGYFLRMLPVYGKFYVSDSYVCFRSRVMGHNTNMILPIADIHFFKKTKATMLGYYGLEILTKAQQEMFFEFGFEHIRDRFVEMVELKMKSIDKEKRKTMSESSSDSQNIINQAIIKDQLLWQQWSANTVSPKASNFGDMGMTNKFDKPLHITCLTIGSRGDVQPYIALAKGLMKEGHKVRIATHGEYKDWVEGHGIEFGYVGGNPAELMRICVENGMFTFGFFKEGLTNFREWLDDLLITSWEACQGTDVIIESPSAMAGIHIAECLGIAYFRAFTMPWTRTRAYPHAFAVPDHDLKGPYNYSSYVLIENAFWLAISPQVNRWRKKTLKLRGTNLEKMEPSTVPFLYNFSEYIVPKAFDWADWIHVTGYWFLDNPDHGWNPPEDLIEFLDRNRKNKKPIVYIGFGSIVVDDPQAMTKSIVEAVQKSGVAAILSKGWSDRLQQKKENQNEEENYPPSIYPLKSVPHDWLFPRIDAVVHHGGAGTTAAGLRAGVPTIIKPFFGDQFFWGDRVDNMGIGFCLKKLSADKLSDYLVKVTTDKKIIKKAELVGENIRKEDGVQNAIQAIYKDLEGAKQRIISQRNGTEQSTSANTTFEIEENDINHTAGVLYSLNPLNQDKRLSKSLKKWIGASNSSIITTNSVTSKNNNTD